MRNNCNTEAFTTRRPYEAPRVEVVEMETLMVLCASSDGGSKGGGDLNPYGFI